MNGVKDVMSGKAFMNAFFRRFAFIVFVLAWFVAFFLFSVSPTFAQRSRSNRTGRERVYAEKQLSELALEPIASAANVVLKPLRPIAGAVLPSFGSNVVGRAPISFSDSESIYEVGSQNITWYSQDGEVFSALAFYPMTPPIDDDKFPVVIYSHGLGSSPENFSYLGRSWASRGVVSIFLHHYETDESLWRGKLRPMVELKEAYHKYWTARDRARAMSSAIDFLYSVNNESGPLGASVDLSRIGVAGNDLGALAALMLAGQLPPDNGALLKDSRVSAVVAISPPVFCDLASAPTVYASITAPLMVVTGTKDDGVVGSTKARQRRIPYDSVSRNDRYLVVLQGADHRVYGGLRVGGQRAAADHSYQETVRVQTSDYFSAYLLKSGDHLERMRSYGYATRSDNAIVEHMIVGSTAKPTYNARLRSQRNYR